MRSPDPAGDVGLGARVLGVGEDLPRLARLDQRAQVEEGRALGVRRLAAGPGRRANQEQRGTAPRSFTYAITKMTDRRSGPPYPDCFF